MPHILYLGNNTQDTDTRARQLAEAAGIICHGLLSEIDHNITEVDYKADGCYHSSIYDINFGRLVELGLQFDQVIMLAQPKSKWSHPDAFYNTVRVIKKLGVVGTFQDVSYKNSIEFFENLVIENPSFCIFPFVELLVNFNHTTVCCRSSEPVTNIDQLESFATDKNYQKIRQSMLKGDLLPDHCSTCYQLEKIGGRSARQQETVEWANRIDITNLEDLGKIQKPSYYEIRPGNKCNLQCRMCSPLDSHLIEREYRKLGIYQSDSRGKKNTTGFDLVDFDGLKKLYVAGGEPTIMTEFYQFLDRCIDNGQTNFEFLINTNGTHLTKKLQDRLQYFSNFQFIFSLDGYQDINHYVRWPSKWDSIIANWHWLRDHGHKVSINTTVSIYNIANLDQLFGFIDQEFPGTLVHCQLVQSSGELNPFLWPDAEQIIGVLNRVQKLPCYHNDSLFSSSIDAYIQQFQQRKQINYGQLKKFYEFNDMLDQSRNIMLVDYIPELDKHRRLLYNHIL